MRIERLEVLSKCPAAVLLAMEGHLELLQRGWTDESSCGLSWNHKAMVAFINDAAVSIITFEEQDWKNAISLHVGYTKSGYRSQRLYTALWDDLCAYASEKGFRRIIGTTHRDNEPMIAVMETLRRELTWLGYEYRLPKQEPPCEP